MQRVRKVTNQVPVENKILLISSEIPDAQQFFSISSAENYEYFYQLK